jgi:MFS family permease
LSSIKRLLALLSVALIAETAAYSAITPLLPHLADEHDWSKAATGIVAAAYPFGTLIFALPSAWVSARIGPQRTVVGALLVLGTSSLLFGLVSSTPLLVATRLGQGVGAAAVWSGGLAWVFAVAPRDRRAEAIGTAIGAAIAGALGGPVIGAAADRIGTGIVFGAFFVLPTVLAVVIARLPGPHAAPSLGMAAFRVAFKEPRMRRGLWLMALPAFGFGLFNVLVPLRLDALGAGAVTIAGAFLGAVVVESAVSPVVGRIADRRGAVFPARIGLGGGGLALLLLPVGGAIAVVALALVAAAALLGMLWTPAMSLLSDGAELRGIDSAFGFGLGNLAWGAGAALGGSGGGALAGATSDAVPYVLLALAALATSAHLRSAAPMPS